MNIDRQPESTRAGPETYDYPTRWWPESRPAGRARDSESGTGTWPRHGRAAGSESESGSQEAGPTRRVRVQELTRRRHVKETSESDRVAGPLARLDR